jgi:hypothetical protein
MEPCTEEDVKKVGKNMKLFKHSYCVKNLSSFGLWNSDEIHHDHIDFHNQLNILVT